MSEAILFVLICYPFISALACFFLRLNFIRSSLIISCVCITGAASLLLQLTPFFQLGGKTGSVLHYLIVTGDFLLLGVMFFLGCRYRHLLIILLSSCQLVIFTVLEFVVFSGSEKYSLFRVDALSLSLVRIVSIVGGLICLHAIPYMQIHEEHRNHSQSGQAQFFAVLLLFIGAMNGLVLTNDLAHFYFFFELTTLCSFLLIRHDGTELAVSNALTALWMNALGGLLLLLAIWGLFNRHATLSIDVLSHATADSPAMLLPLGLLIIAALTKSAQLPWQKWLLGAMIAPTPTSALLHSSTMVKAGVYIVLRFAPSFSGTMLAHALVLAGGFTFLAAAVLAIGQRNAKKVLAYSTISNLGLIFACAGIGTLDALVAGTMLIVFHAVSKGLLFLCVGTAEQQVRSRDIEVMRGLCSTMPFTGIIAVVGALTLILPPFGMLFGKWMVFEAGADSTVFYLMLVVGSACTVLYWVRLAGTLLMENERREQTAETRSFLTRLPLTFLVCGAILLGVAVRGLYRWIMTSFDAGLDMGFVQARIGRSATVLDGFPVSLLFSAVFFVGLAVLFVLARRREWKKSAPYLAGANIGHSVCFRGPMGKTVHAIVENSYLPAYFDEARLTGWINFVAAGLLFYLIGGGLWA